MKTDIKLAGVGGQGILSTDPIHSDLIPRGWADLILSMEPMEALRHLAILSPDELRKAIRTVFARKGDKVVADNLKAFDAGYEGLQ